MELLGWDDADNGFVGEVMEPGVLVGFGEEVVGAGVKVG